MRNYSLPYKLNEKNSNLLTKILTKLQLNISVNLNKINFIMADYGKAIDIATKVIYAINFATILGSFFTFIVFSRKSFEKSSIGLYCKSLAIFDLVVAVYFGFGIASLITQVSLINNYDSLCKIYNYIQTAISPIPSWILVAFSLDQLIIVSRTNLLAFFKKRWFQYALILGIFIFHCAIYVPIILIMSVQAIPFQANIFIYACVPANIIMPVVYLIESVLIPFICLIFTMSLVVRILIKSRRKIAPNLQRNALASRRYQEYKFAFNSVVLGVLFIVLSLHVVISFILNQAGILTDFSLFSLINILCYVLFYLNFALHFWVHLGFNSVFRKEFLILLRIKKRNDFVNSITGPTKTH